MGVRGRPQVPRITVPCAACGQPVTKRESDYLRAKTGRVFCDDACRKRAGSKPRRGKTQPCEECGLEVYSRPGAPGRFCSTACHNTHQKRNRVDITCPVCAHTFSLGKANAAERQRNGQTPCCSRRCDAERRATNGIGRYHNGRQVLRWSSGYLYLWEPAHPNAIRNGWIAEHRWVMEQRLGRVLTTDENVHHLNGVKTDNRLENLEVLSHSAHSTITQAERKAQMAADAAELAEYRRRYGPLE